MRFPTEDFKQKLDGAVLALDEILLKGQREKDLRKTMHANWYISR